MQTVDYRINQHKPALWNRIRAKLIYLPGAMIIAYGSWLSLGI